MIVSNITWTRVGGPGPALLTMQNVGYVRIAYVVQGNADDPPQSDDDVEPQYVGLDTDDHFILAPGSEPVTFDYLATESLSVYARALGPKDGALAVTSIAP